MIRVVCCDGCDQQLLYRNRFVYTLVARISRTCTHCGQSHDDLSGRAWHFCSVACLQKLRSCKACSGFGYQGFCEGAELGSGAETCPVCEGRGLEVKK